MRQNWKKLVWGVFVICLLTVSFWYGGNAPGLQGFFVSTTETAVSEGNEMQQPANEKRPVANNSTDGDKETSTTEEPQNIFQQIVMNIKLKKAFTSSNKTQNSKKAQENANKSAKKQQKKNKKSKKKKTATKTESTAQNNTATSESNHQQENTTGVTTESSYIENTTEQITEETTEQEEVAKDTVTISISCAALLDEMDLLKDAKRKYVPKDGIVLAETEVPIEEGDTVFDVLQKVTRQEKIHLEFNYTPAYKSHYIEGINNIYEYDAGNLSGWMYCLNGEFTGLGCSFCEVEDGDEIKWLYTCNLGKDVGDYFAE